MPVKTKPVTFESHGREFDNEADAKRHDALCAAREKFENAQRLYEKSLGESCRTADGHRFEFGVFGDYYRVVAPFHTMPYVRKTSYYCSSWSVRSPHEEPDVVEIRENRYDADGPREDHWTPIRELYADPKKALAALDAARAQWLSDVTAQVAEDAKRDRRL